MNYHGICDMILLSTGHKGEQGMSDAMTKISRVELLSPAGDIERLKCALLYGADAVYLAGTSFGMRAGANNFTHEQLNEGVKLAHAAGAKVYVTCNTIPRNGEIDALPDFLERTADAGADAFIIADIGVMRLAQKYAPKVPVHISTQAGVANYATANEFYNMGASRVVLARELCFEEIAELRGKTPSALEIEAFVHGSMCVSFSGRCLLSSYMTGRDANRGDCAQPCRWKYYLTEEKREGQKFEIFEDNGTHILNSRDMCMIEYIPRLVECGITSFKIEGRAKSAYYTAAVTNAYRQAIDGYYAAPSPHYKPDPAIPEELNKVSHREYSTGFYLGNEPGQVLANGGYVREYKVAGMVEDCGGGWLTLSQRNKFRVGDTLDIMPPHAKPLLLPVTEMFDGEGNSIGAAPHAMMTVRIPYDGAVIPKGSFVRIKE